MSEEKYCLLLVDDHLPNIKILGNTFLEEGFKVLTATDVETAQKVIFTQRSEIDLVLSDIQMPGLTGFDLVRWAKSVEFDEVPILLITSQLPEPKHRIFGLSLGAVDYVLRSLDPQELVARVRRSIEHFRQLRQLKASLDDSENLASVGRFLAAANHEVKNLAHMIQLITTILARDINSSNLKEETSQRGLHSLLEASKLLADITKNMHAMIDENTSAVAPFEITKVSQQVIEMMQPIFKGIFIESSIDRSVPTWALGNITPFKQMLINLMLNAKEAIREATPTEGGHISINISLDGTNVCLEVIDNGVGFPAEEVRTDFPAFATTKQMRGGKGLGLWLSNRFVKSMGGNLKLSSKGPGKGACAQVVLQKTLGRHETEPAIDISSYFIDEDT